MVHPSIHDGAIVGKAAYLTYSERVPFTGARPPQRHVPGRRNDRPERQTRAAGRPSPTWFPTNRPRYRQSRSSSGAAHRESARSPSTTRPATATPDPGRRRPAGLRAPQRRHRPYRRRDRGRAPPDLPEPGQRDRRDHPGPLLGQQRRTRLLLRPRRARRRAHLVLRRRGRPPAFGSKLGGPSRLHLRKSRLLHEPGSQRGEQGTPARSSTASTTRRTRIPGCRRARPRCT